ncbi:hypothetical protein GCM10010400_45410 [Streptomyces aculeolatus]
MDARVGDLSGMTAEELAALFGGADAIVFSAGSNGGSREVTRAVDGDGVPRIGRQILELDGGSTPIGEAVRANVRQTGP